MREVFVAQTTSNSQPAASPLTYVILAAIAVWLVQTQTGLDLLAPVRGLVGGSDEDPVLPTAGTGPGFGLSRPRTIVIGTVAALALAIFAGVLRLPSGVRVPLAAALVLVATYLTLRGLGSYSATTFAVVGGGVVILGLSALGEPLIGAIVNSRVFPIIALGGLYLAYKAVTALGDDGGGGSGRVVRVVRRGGDDGS